MALLCRVSTPNPFRERLPLSSCYDLPHRSYAREDLDMDSYGVVKVFEDRLGDRCPDMPWEPKAAFEALARRYVSSR